MHFVLNNWVVTGKLSVEYTDAEQEENELLNSFLVSFIGKIAMEPVHCAQWASVLEFMLLENALLELNALSTEHKWLHHNLIGGSLLLPKDFQDEQWGVIVF